MPPLPTFIMSHNIVQKKITEKFNELIEKVLTPEQLIQTLNFAGVALFIRHNDELNNTKFQK